MYVTDDGGKTWRASNDGVRAEFLPDKYPEFGQCVHKVVQASGTPERLYLQNLSFLWREHPALRECIVTEQNVVRPHVNVFVDGESIRFTGGLRASVSDGSEIVILPAVSGG